MLIRIVYDDETGIAHTFRGTSKQYTRRSYQLTERQYHRLWLAMRHAGGSYRSIGSAWVWDR